MQPTYFDRMVAAVKNRPLLAVLLFCAAAVISVANLVGAWNLLRGTFLGPARPPDQAFECRFVAVDSLSFWESLKRDVKLAHVNMDEHTFSFDGGDIRVPRAFVFKGYDSGTYSIKTEVELEGPQSDYLRFRTYVSEVEFGSAQFYRLQWEPTLRTSADRIDHVATRAVTKAEFLRAMRDRLPILPACASLRRGHCCPN